MLIVPGQYGKCRTAACGWAAAGTLLVAGVLLAGGRLPAAAAPARPDFRRHEITSGTVLNGAALVDVDGDRHTDVIAAGPDQLSWYRREGERWEAHPIAARSADLKSTDSICLTVFDLDQDQDPDLITSTPGNGDLAWYENPRGTTGPWVRHLIDNLPKIHSQVLQDVTGDGKPELVANTTDQLVWFGIPAAPRKASPAKQGEAAGPRWSRQLLTSDGVTGTPHYLSSADLRGDGRQVLLAGSPDGAYLAWWEKGAGSEWRRHVLKENLTGCSHLRFLDMDGDGKSDLFYSRGHEAGSAWLAGPEWKQETAVDPGLLREPHALDVGDLNGDQVPEVAAAARTQGGLVLWWNDGHGRFTATQLDADQRGMDLKIHDLDGDGDADLLVAGATGKNLVWYENRLR